VPKPSPSFAPGSVAIIGDIVGSRKLSAPRRKAIQSTLNHLIHQLNQSYAQSLKARFNIALGDEFEGLIETTAAPDVLPGLIWTVEKEFPNPVIRLGVGLGAITADAGEFASDWDGPAFHRAREAVDLAGRKKLLGGLFRGFGETHDLILNGLARVLHHQRRRWSPQQRRVAILLHDGHSQTEAARQMDVSTQAVSSYAAAAGWNAYTEGETALRMALEEAVAPAASPH
jgi:hypothetical protein